MNFEIKITGHNLPEMDINGSSDPYFKIYVDDIQKSQYKSKHINNELNPVWAAFKITMQPWEECGAGNWLAFDGGKSCDIVLNSSLRIEVFDKDVLKDDFMGLCCVSLTDLVSSEVTELKLVDRKGDLKSSFLKIEVSKYLF